jgi:ribosome-associated heat shock protein Hsp15
MARRPDGSEDGPASDAGAQRLDKWLWYARVAKSRKLASGLVVDGKVRVNRQKVSKPAHGVRVGDVVTVSVARGVRVLKIESTGTRRGPATEARTLYEEIVPLPQGRAGGTKAQAARAVDQGALLDVQRGASARGERPTKRERRQIDRLKPRFDE